MLCFRSEWGGLNWRSLAGAVLGWHFREHGINSESLLSFNAERGPRVKEVYTKVSQISASQGIFLSGSSHWTLLASVSMRMACCWTKMNAA